VKEFVILLLGFTFVTLIACPVQFVAADHLKPGIGIYKDETHVNLISVRDTKYQLYLQVEVRNAQGQLVGIFEGTHGNIIPHKITDLTFDEKLGEKEIITIDNIKYEKVQYIFSPTLEQRWTGFYPIFSEIPLEFKYEEGVVAKMNKKIKNYSIWKIHYCAAFEGHGYTCIPVFQALVPTMTLEPDDVVTQQWTILREMN